MQPNVQRYRASRVAFTIGAVVALGLRVATQNTTWPLIALGVAVVVGLVIDLAIRKA
ncbi:MAG: hypothetical protein ACOX2L_10850 [Anaerolineae bacterium]|jgi:hypothetical protein|nr:hypothetical protein [Chloroflexota bacterium]